MGTDDVKGFLPRKRTTGRITQPASRCKRITPDNYAMRTSCGKTRNGGHANARPPRKAKAEATRTPSACGRSSWWRRYGRRGRPGVQTQAACRRRNRSAARSIFCVFPLVAPLCHSSWRLRLQNTVSPRSSVSCRLSAFIHAIISTSHVSTSCTMHGISPSALNFNSGSCACIVGPFVGRVRRRQSMTSRQKNGTPEQTRRKSCEAGGLLQAHRNAL